MVGPRRRSLCQLVPILELSCVNYGGKTVGDGEFDNLGQIRALLKAGYEEAFTLETYDRSPEGKAHATRTSLTALLTVIDKV